MFPSRRADVADVRNAVYARATPITRGSREIWKIDLYQNIEEFSVAPKWVAILKFGGLDPPISPIPCHATITFGPQLSGAL
ncbi:hypothetical protein BOO89_07050 [Stutzerimonas stutzeri]|nr:hypothetical protein BOO89_07050 [Stutzerimonas stutzeri]